MLVPMLELLRAAESRNYAIGAFNVYNAEGLRAVVLAAADNSSPAVIQIHPGALKRGGRPLVALCLAAAQDAPVPIALHFDHASCEADLQTAVAQGFGSVMFDGSELEYSQNLKHTRDLAAIVHERGVGIEAELGRLSGSEDGLSVPAYREKLTDPAQATEFVRLTGVDALAVCIGNVHGRYAREPQLDFERLEQLRSAVSVPLVLHGASGLPNSSVRRSIALNVRKFNVNTELREAYVKALRSRLSGASQEADLVELMEEATAAMRAVVSAKLKLFGSAGAVSTSSRQGGDSPSQRMNQRI